MFYIPDGQDKLRLRAETGFCLTDYVGVKLNIRKPDGTTYLVDAIIETPCSDNGWFYYDIQSTDFNELGLWQITAWLIDGDGKVVKSKKPIGIDVKTEFEECTNVVSTSS